MSNELSAPDAARRREPDRHLEDDPAALDTFLAAKKAEHDRQEADKAAWDRSAALFTSKLPVAMPAVAALRAQLAAPAPSTLSKEDAHALAAHANQTLALYGGNVRPIAKHAPPSAPAAVPVALSSEDELNARIAAEREFQGGMRSGSLTPHERASREAALATLQHAADEGSADASVRKAALYQDLSDLGAPQPCRATDTVESLTAQRDAILGAQSTRARDADDRRATMGLDGKIGTPYEVALYEAEQRLETFPKTGTGVLLVGIASARGASTEELRAAGARGEMVEGLAGGAAHVFENERSSRSADVDTTESLRDLDVRPPPRPVVRVEANRCDVTPDAAVADPSQPAADPPAPPSFRRDDLGRTIEARGIHEGPHRGRPKGYAPVPVGGVASGDHRGHLIPEGTVSDPRTVNVRPNIISESARSNLGPKKKFDNLVARIAAANPGKRVETVHNPVFNGDNTRPAVVLHRILVDGREVHSIEIPNE
jgi:hypothetical protein